MLKGTLHVHSTYSDGEFTLAELRDLFVRQGCRFACVTDHAEWFDAARLDAYRRECDALSDRRFRFIAGLEYGCVNRMHIVGYGVTSLIESCDPEHVITEIDRLEGIAVIAHPSDEAFATIARFDPLPAGIEVWNSKYDGRYAPRPGTFALLASLRTKRADMTAFYGQDLHWRTQYKGLFTGVGCDAPNREDLVDALRRGNYVGIHGDLQLPSNGVLPRDLLCRFERAHARSQQMRRWIRRAKSLADHSGLPLPGSLKSQLRRIF